MDNTELVILFTCLSCYVTHPGGPAVFEFRGLKSIWLARC
jgi:hypothetical protein